MKRSVVDWPVHSDSDSWVVQLVAQERESHRSAVQLESKRRAACYRGTYYAILGLVAVAAFLAGLFVYQIVGVLR